MIKSICQPLCEEYDWGLLISYDSFIIIGFFEDF